MRSYPQMSMTLAASTLPAQFWSGLENHRFFLTSPFQDHPSSHSSLETCLRDPRNITFLTDMPSNAKDIAASLLRIPSALSSFWGSPDSHFPRTWHVVSAALSTSCRKQFRVLPT